MQLSFEALTGEQAAEPSAATPRAARGTQNAAERLGAEQRAISVSEFFTKNRHLLGFDNASRALLTAVKEAVDNALDACEEAGIAPDITIQIAPAQEGRYTLYVEDNGPGIVRAQVPRVFGQLLYGSKFHRLRQSRGQQGIGISAAALYAQLTTGKPIAIVTKVDKTKPAYRCEIALDTSNNTPVVMHEGIDTTPTWMAKAHGTALRLELEGVYKSGRHSVDEWVQQVALANPHARLEYHAPGQPPMVFVRVSDALPPRPRDIKPHPYGVELGTLQRLLQSSRERPLGSFLQAEFSRISPAIAEELCVSAGLQPSISSRAVRPADAEALYRAISGAKLRAPSMRCLAPIGASALRDGLKALLVQTHLFSRAAGGASGGEPTLELPGLSVASSAEERLRAALGMTECSAVESDNLESSEGAARQPADSWRVSVAGDDYFVTTVTRAPGVYRGNPFVVEAALAYGGSLPCDEPVQLCRFANRVPLVFQPGACAMTQAVLRTNWKGYDVEQPRGGMPVGPMLILVHIASVWVPFTSEAKEAVAHYDEIIAELKLALQECGRRLHRYLRREKREASEREKSRYVHTYIPHIGEALRDILGFGEEEEGRVVSSLTAMLSAGRE
jgi:DNA topoisomerase VI subunit B